MPATMRARVRHGKLAGGEIIQEEQRLRALHHQIVHAHRHQVDADAVVQPRIERHHELGAHTVGRGDQNRVGKACPTKIKQRAKTA